MQISTGEAASATVSIPVNVPIGAWGSYVINVSVNGSLVNTQTIDDAENWAGGNISVAVSGKGEETVVLSVTCSASGKTSTYGQYTVDYKAKDYTTVSNNSNCFVDITPEQPTEAPETDAPTEAPSDDGYAGDAEE